MEMVCLFHFCFLIAWFWRETGASVNCTDAEFRCNDGMCIEIIFQCDYYNDCMGGEDEDSSLCQSVNCRGDVQFICNDGSCIDIMFRCDNYLDCANGEDEDPSICSAPKCSTTEFRCNDGSCIDIMFKCDDFYNCVHGEDEDSSICHEQQYHTDTTMVIAAIIPVIIFLTTLFLAVCYNYLHVKERIRDKSSNEKANQSSDVQINVIDIPKREGNRI